MNVYLIGYRCTGKTSVGRMLAERLGIGFTDSDDDITARMGQSIAEAVAAHGWAYFRAAERWVIQRLAETGGRVIATGGGAVLDPENVRAMQQSGVIVWLRATAGVIRNRMEQDENTAECRPALTQSSAADEIDETLKTRLPLYRRAMNTSIDTDACDIETVCDQILLYLHDGEQKRAVAG
jgi:shikimate kinase